MCQRSLSHSFFALSLLFFFFNDTATTEIYTLSLHDALPILHADTRLPYDAYTSLCAALREFDVVGGNFALRFGGEDRFSRVLGAWYAGQRRLGIYYGDSAIWTRRGAVEALGG